MYAVALVVTVPPVAHEVDDHVVAVFRAIRHGEPYGGETRFGPVRVDVEDREVESLGQVAGVARGAALPRVGGEADLVVDDEVHGAAHAVAVEASEVQRFGHHALGGEGRVPVDEDRDHRRGVLHGVRAPRIACAGPSP